MHLMLVQVAKQCIPIFWAITCLHNIVIGLKMADKRLNLKALNNG